MAPSKGAGEGESESEEIVYGSACCCGRRLDQWLDWEYSWSAWRWKLWAAEAAGVAEGEAVPGADPAKRFSGIGGGTAKAAAVARGRDGVDVEMGLV